MIVFNSINTRTMQTEKKKIGKIYSSHWLTKLTSKRKKIAMCCCNSVTLDICNNFMPQIKNSVPSTCKIIFISIKRMVGGCTVALRKTLRKLHCRLLRFYHCQLTNVHFTFVFFS